MEAAVSAYCSNIKERLNGEHYAKTWAQKLHTVDSTHFSNWDNGPQSVYDVFSNYACIDNAENDLQGQAKHASNYVNLILGKISTIFGN